VKREVEREQWLTVERPRGDSFLSFFSLFSDLFQRFNKILLMFENFGALIFMSLYLLNILNVCHCNVLFLKSEES
jgi:hypothetical protein